MRLLRVLIRRPGSNPSRRRWWVLLYALVQIPIWQAAYVKDAGRLDDTHRNTSAVGLQQQAELVYFYYYLGLYPVTSRTESREYSEAGARRLLAEGGDNLVMEGPDAIYGATRIGDHGRILLYLPDALRKGAPKLPSVRPANIGAFWLALDAAFAAFWWIGRPLLGALVVLLVGSSPFQVYEIYANENIFGWGSTTALLALALNLPLMARRDARGRAAWLAPVLTGALLGTVRHVRSEPAAMILAVLAAYLLLDRATRWRRVGLAAALLVSFGAASAGWSGYFRFKIALTAEVVRQAGGHPHPHAARPEMHHNFWLPIWDGLGDFGEKHGYEWNDVAAHAYAWRVLRWRGGQKLPPWLLDSYVLDKTYLDPAQRYAMLPSEVPGYTEVLRDKVLHDILHDPLWYAGVLFKRLGRILVHTAPVQVAFGSRELSLATTGIPALAVMILLALARARLLLQLCLFTAPLSIAALTVYSKRGMTSSGTYHLFATAVALAAAVEGWRWWRRFRSRSLGGMQPKP